VENQTILSRAKFGDGIKESRPQTLSEPSLIPLPTRRRKNSDTEND